MSTVLFISEERLKETSVINGNVDNKLLLPTIVSCQEMYIQPILGSGIYNQIKTQIADGTIADAGNASNKLLLDSFIIPCLVSWIMYELPIDLTYKFTNKNFGSKTSENSQPGEIAAIEKVMDRYKNKAEFRSERMTMYLKQNRTTFPLYDNPGTGFDVIRPQGSNFTCGMYLDDDSPAAMDSEYLYYKYKNK
jgi:hypothetical protein